MQDIVSWDHISNIKTPSDNRLQTLQLKLRALLMLRNLVFVISPTNWYSVWENDLLWLTGQASIYHFSRHFVCFCASTQASVLTKHCLPITATKNLHCTFKYLQSIGSASCFFLRFLILMMASTILRCQMMSLQQGWNLKSHQCHMLYLSKRINPYTNHLKQVQCYSWSDHKWSIGQRTLVSPPV